MIIHDDNKKKRALQKLRETECFTVINRGKAWYDLLTLEQESELKQWYIDWLNVTETEVIPNRPAWLDEKLDTEVELL